MSTQTGQLAALNSALAITTDAGGLAPTFPGSACVSVNLTSSAFVGTVSFQGTVDGVNWIPLAAHQLLGSGIVGGLVTSTTVAGQFIIPNYGFQQVRVIASSFTSGLMTAFLDMSIGAPSGQQYANIEGQKASFSAAVNAHAPAATPTDWFTLQGSATKTIRITRIKIRARATAANQYRISVKKYSVFLTGGTPAAVTAVAHDSGDSAATAAVQTWAGGLPTPGTLVGAIEDESVPMSVLGTPVFDGPVLYDYAVRPSRAIVLRGIAQYVALNSAGVALPAGSVFDVKFEWTEE